MTDNKNNSFQELNDDELDDVNGGIIGNVIHLLLCKTCQNRFLTEAGKHLPEQCPQCGSSDLTMI